MQKYSNAIFRVCVVKTMKTDYVAINGTMAVNDVFGRVSCACQGISFIKLQKFGANTFLPEIPSIRQ
jgi:hypothetical protein